MGDLGSRIRVLRRAKGLTQAQLTAKATISQSHLSAIETSGRTGEDVQPSGAILKRIAQALEVSVGQLLGEEEARSGVASAPSHHVVPFRRGPALPEFSESLDDYIKLCKKRKEPLTEEEKWGLAGINSKGRVPETVGDWDFIMQAIRRAVARP